MSFVLHIYFFISLLLHIFSPFVSLVLRELSRVSTKWLYCLRKICAIFAQIFFLRTFAQFLRMKRNEFCAVLLLFSSGLTPKVEQKILQLSISWHIKKLRFEPKLLNRWLRKNNFTICLETGTSEE